MVLTCRDDRYEALTAQGRVAFRRGGDGDLGHPRDRGHRPARRPVDRPVHPARRRAGPPPPASGPPTPTRTPTTRSPSSSTRRPPRTSASSTRPRTTGRTRVGIGASTVRSRSCSRARRLVFGGKGVRKVGLVPRAARLVDVAPTIAALLGCAPHGDGRYLAKQDGAVLDDRHRSGSSARVTSSASSSTARTPTSSTTWLRAARHRTSRA